MQTIETFLIQNWLTLVVAAIGILVSYLFYAKSKLKPKLIFAYESIQITGAHSKIAPELEIYFGGKKLNESLGQWSICGMLATPLLTGQPS